MARSMATYVASVGLACVVLDGISAWFVDMAVEIPSSIPNLGRITQRRWLQKTWSE